VKIQFTVTGSVFAPDDHFVERDPVKLAWAIERVLKKSISTNIGWPEAPEIQATVTATPSTNSEVTP